MLGLNPILLIILVLGVFFVVILLYFFSEKLSLKNKVKKALNFRMLLISLPKEIKPKEGETPTTYKEVIGVAEHLFSNLMAITPKQYLTFEIIALEGAISFYLGCLKELIPLIEKQVHSFYPTASIEEVPHILFFKSDEDKIAAGTLALNKKYIWPVKTYLKLESDSLNAITNALSKLGEESAAAIQILAKPTTKYWQRACDWEARKIQEGKRPGEGMPSVLSFLSDLGKTAKGEKTTPSGMPEKQRPIVLTPLQESAVKILHEKAQKTGFDTQVRIVVKTKDDLQIAESHLKNIASAFNQFYSPELNGLRLIKSKNPQKTAKYFILRAFDDGPKLPLNTEELASIYHFPNRFIETPNIKWLLAKRMPASPNLPPEGTIIGENIYRGEKRLIKIKEDDRRRHIYMIGKTGCGKTTTFLEMAESDIKEGKGICYIDPHGDAIALLLPRIPQERAEDVILFDPSDMDRPCGLNLLEWKKEEDKDFLVAEWINIFYKLYDPTRIGIIGPQWEHWGRNAALTCMEQPEGGTLIEIPRLFTDDDFREEMLKNVKNPMVLAFWQKQIAQTAEFHKSEMLNYFVSKFGRFMTNTMMRNIIGQVKNSFDLREIMDNGKILLVNLAKGKIGEMNAYLLGMILVSRLQMAAMSRADLPEEERKDFYLYVDEFQNFTTESFISILAEARKYRLNLNVTNQYIAQLPEDIRNAVIGNAGTLITFRVGAMDAEFLSKEFEGLSETDLMNLDNFNAYIKLLIDGVASKPFSLRTIKPEPTPLDKRVAETIRQLSRLKYGRDRAIVEQEIYKRVRLDLVAGFGEGEVSEAMKGV